MFAALAHHLCASGVSLDGNVAHWTPLDLRVAVVQHHDVAHQGGRVKPVPTVRHLDQLAAVFVASEAGMPVGGAQRAKLLLTTRTLDGHSTVEVRPAAVGRRRANVANSLAASRRTPSTVGIQSHLWSAKEDIEMIQ